MKLCIVGNGPSAKGHGREIDACDVVVRMKAFWLRGAEDAGDKIDVWAWFGMTDSTIPDFVPAEDIPAHIPKHTTHWFMDCMEHVVNCRYHERLEAAKQIAGAQEIYQISNDMRNHAAQYLNCAPATGLLAICMAMECFLVEELVLYGFDSTGYDKPNHADARGIPTTKTDEDPSLDLLAEKRAIAEILKGTWLGKPTAATLIWPDMPKDV